MAKPLWSVDQIVSQLTNWGAAWDNDSPIAYTFYEALAAHLGNPPNFSPFSIAQREAVARLLELISDVADLDFIQVADNGQAPSATNQRFGMFNLNGANVPFWGAATNYDMESATIPYGEIYGVDIVVNGHRAIPQGNWAIGDSNPRKLLHEILHVLGLDHAGDYNGDSANYENDALFLQDSNQYTVMSYWAAAASGADHVAGGVIRFAATPLLFDVASLQKLYGANMTTRTGDTVYGFNSTAGRSEFNFAINTSPVVTIWDAGGADTLDFSGFAGGSVLDLNEGAFSDTGDMARNISIAFGAIIENAVGGSGNDIVIGNSVSNRLMLHLGGNDTAQGGDGDDVLFYGGAFNLADISDGGAGNDTLVLQGNYGISLAADSLIGIEGISLQSGSVTRWGQSGNNSYDYVVTTVNANVLAGQQFRVNAQSLLPGEDFTFNGSTETDGGFLVFAGFGIDRLTGSDSSHGDVFFFEAGRFGQGDLINGGLGDDAVIISGVAAGEAILSATIFSGTFQSIEALSVNGRFASDPNARPSYQMVLENGNIASGAQLIVNASSLSATQTFSFDASQVTTGSLLLFGGAGGDQIKGSANGDLFYAAGAQDILFGGGGADIFQYRALGDSAVDARDLVQDFLRGTDKIDLSRIDADLDAAGDQGFAFIGEDAFSGAIGQLRAYSSGNGSWFVDGDINGDGLADFRIEIVTTDNLALASSDFLV
jgi:hypothetical protein